MQPASEHPEQHNALRIAVVVLILIAVLSYIAGVLGGAIPKTRQLDGTHLTLLLATLLLCVLILRPQSLDRLSRFEGLGFKVELLQRLQERQVQQAEELYRLDLIVPLLFRDVERKHLSNLMRGTTKNYHGGGALRDELRRLRAIGLLKSLPNRHIGDLHTDTEFDLADWVTLTDFGRYWAERLAHLGQAASEPIPSAADKTPD